MILSGKKSICSHFCRLYSGWMLVAGLLLIGFSAKAATPLTVGAPSKTWTVPEIYSYDDEITWYFDMTGSGVAETQELYLRVWEPSEPDTGNYTPSPASSKLTYIGNFVWKITLTPTKFFNKTIEQIKARLATTGIGGYWMRLKSKDMTVTDIETDVFSVQPPTQKIADFKTSGVAVAVYPSSFKVDTLISIVVNLSKVYVNGNIGGFAGKDSVYMQSGLDNGLTVLADVNNQSTLIKTKMKKLDTNVFAINFRPYQYYEVAKDYDYSNLVFKLLSKDGIEGFSNASGELFMLGNASLPVISVFPQKFCQYDILTITRGNNEKWVTSVDYSIDAINNSGTSTKTITGSLSGNIVAMKISIDLNKEIGTQVNLEKLRLKISVKKGSIVASEKSYDLPIVPLTDLQ